MQLRASVGSIVGRNDKYRTIQCPPCTYWPRKSWTLFEFKGPLVMPHSFFFFIHRRKAFFLFVFCFVVFFLVLFCRCCNTQLSVSVLSDCPNTFFFFLPQLFLSAEGSFHTLTWSLVICDITKLYTNSTWRRLVCLFRNCLFFSTLLCSPLGTNLSLLLHSELLHFLVLRCGYTTHVMVILRFFILHQRLESFFRDKMFGWMVPDTYLQVLFTQYGVSLKAWPKCWAGQHHVLYNVSHKVWSLSPKNWLEVSFFSRGGNVARQDGRDGLFTSAAHSQHTVWASNVRPWNCVCQTSR